MNPPPPITVRRLRTADCLEQLTRLLHRSYAPQVEMGLRPLAGRQTADQTRERTSSGECFVATAHVPGTPTEKLVGTILFQEVETASFPPFFLLPSVAHFSLLAVDPDIQGAGIGGKLIDAVEARARELGMAELALSMAAPDAALNRFYEKRGFRTVEHWQWPYTNYVSAIMSRPVSTARPSRLSECFIRPAKDDDARGLINLIADVWSEYPGCILDVDREEPDLRAIASAYEHKRGGFWCATDKSGTIVGSAGIVPLAAKGRFELKKLYVHKSHRGTGLGTRLLGWAESETKRRGGSVLELWSDTRFLDAHRFYERHNYIKGSLTRDLHDLSNSTEYHYAKRL